LEKVVGKVGGKRWWINILFFFILEKNNTIIYTKNAVSTRIYIYTAERRVRTNPK
jgi:hypothetical protein